MPVAMDEQSLAQLDLHRVTRKATHTPSESDEPIDDCLSSANRTLSAISGSRLGHPVVAHMRHVITHMLIQPFLGIEVAVTVVAVVSTSSGSVRSRVTQMLVQCFFIYKFSIAVPALEDRIVSPRV